VDYYLPTVSCQTMPEFKGLPDLNSHLATRSYVEGYSPSAADVEALSKVNGVVDGAAFPHVARWANHIRSFSPCFLAKLPGAAAPTNAPVTEKKADAKKEEPKKQEQKKDQPKQESKKDDPKKEEPKAAQPKKEEPKKPESKKDEPKKAEPKKEEPKAAQPAKKEEPKKPESKKEEPKKGAPAPAPAKQPAKKPEPEPEEDDEEADEEGDEEAGDDEFNLIDSDEDEETKKLMAAKQEQVKASQSRQAAKAGDAKSNLTLDVKPLDSDTDMKVVEAKIRAIAIPGSKWLGGQLIPLVYGLKKLRIMCQLTDVLCNVDQIQEAVEALPEVQSTDVFAFQMA